MPDGTAGAPPDGGTTELIFARDALRIAIATERSGLEFYTRAARITQDARGRTVFQKLAEEEKEHLGTLEARYRQLLDDGSRARVATDVPVLQGRGERAVRRGRRAAAPEGVDDQQALLIGIQCERGSHRFFKKYGERFEESEGKQIFLEFADEEKQHLELLIREYRALTERDRSGNAGAARRPRRAQARRARRRPA